VCALFCAIISGKNCQPFWRYVDAFDESAEQLRRISLKHIGKEHAVASEELICRYRNTCGICGIRSDSVNMVKTYVRFWQHAINYNVKYLVFKI
jgi:hypothetical protein